MDFPYLLSLQHWDYVGVQAAPKELLSLLGSDRGERIVI